jgi:peptidyl-prolyl cis-trans isomerase SurA
MRRLLLLFLGLTTIAFAQEDTNELPKALGSKTLMVVNGDSVSADDFWYVFNKNNFNNDTPSVKSMSEYLELYKVFRLKVEAAYAEGLDTTQKFLQEFSSYKDQLADSYLNDKSVTEELILEAYERSKTEVDASHILISIPEHAIPSDTLEAYKKISEIRKRAQNGEDFEQLAMMYSDDPSAAKNKGRLGYFTAFQMVYPFESAAFNTNKGEISKVLRTRFGYHILKVHDKRDAQGKIKVAHIMVIDDKDPEEAKVNERKINEIYEKLSSDQESFESLARKFSEHVSSSKKGGELPWFSGDKYDSAFVAQSYSLKENGDYTKPFKSEYGWHIVKRLDYEELKSFDDMQRILKQKVAKSDRANVSKRAVLDRIKKEYGFSEKPKNLHVFYDIVDSSFLDGKWEIPSKPKLKKVLFTFNKDKYTQKDFAEYLVYKMVPRKGGNYRQMVTFLYDQWKEELLTNYEKTRLAIKHPRYNRLLREYKDGIILFELTDKMVWSMAVKDSAGLAAYFEENKQNWEWEQRYRADVYRCISEEVANKVRNYLLAGMSNADVLEKVNEKSTLNTRLNSGVFEQSERKELGDKEYEAGVTEVIAFQGAHYVLRIDSVLPPSPKALNNVRGLVTAAYQDVLMEKWVSELNAKYPIFIQEETWKELLKYVDSLN